MTGWIIISLSSDDTLTKTTVSLYIFFLLIGKHKLYGDSRGKTVDTDYDDFSNRDKSRKGFRNLSDDSDQGRSMTSPQLC